MSRGGGGGRNARPTGVSVLANHLGIQRGEIITQAVAQPPPLFPLQDSKPLPLSTSDDYGYMVALKNEFLNRMRESAYFLKDREPKKDIDRYSDKYRKVAVEPWTPYYNRIPKELWPKHMTGDSKPSSSKASKKRKIDGNAKTDASVAKKFENLEKRELERTDAKPDDTNKETKKKKGEDDEDEDGEAKDDEQELSDDDYREEDNDYIQNYFDNGDNYLDDSEENLDDEALY